MNWLIHSLIYQRLGCAGISRRESRDYLRAPRCANVLSLSGHRVHHEEEEMEVVTWNTLLHFSSTYPVDKDKNEPKKKRFDWWLIGWLSCWTESYLHHLLRWENIYYHQKLIVKQRTPSTNERGKERSKITTYIFIVTNKFGYSSEQSSKQTSKQPQPRQLFVGWTAI